MPVGLMATARKLRLQGPAQAAGLAMRAVAIGLLTSLPLRLSNTINLRLDRHLQRANPPRGPMSIIRIAPEEQKTAARSSSAYETGCPACSMIGFVTTGTSSALPPAHICFEGKAVRHGRSLGPVTQMQDRPDTRGRSAGTKGRDTKADRPRPGAGNGVGTGASGRLLSVVAGAGFEPATFRL